MRLIRDRYRPPRAGVADLSAPGRGPRPAMVVIAMTLVWGVLFAQMAVLVHSWSLYTIRSRPMFLLMAVLTLLWMINCILVVMLQLNRNWARLAYLAVYLLALPLALYPLWLKSTGDPLAFLWRLPHSALQTAAVFLLFTRPARKWFRADGG